MKVKLNTPWWEVWPLPSGGSRAPLPLGDGVVVVSRDALMAMKAQVARPQDLMDIANLKDLDR